MVHGSVPAEVKQKKHDRPERIAELLRLSLPLGKESALSCKQIAEGFSFKTDRTYLNIRTAAKLLLAQGLPVVTCAKGIFIAQKPEELEAYVESLMVTVRGYLRTIELVNQVKNKVFEPEQVQLFETK